MQTLQEKRVVSKDMDLSAIIDLTEMFAKDLGICTYQKIYQNKTKITDYKILNNLAKGGFGEVFVAEKAGEIYAIKRLSKDMVKRNKNSAFFMLEKEIMTDIDSDWIVRAHECIQDDIYLYFVMDFISGGDLLGYLSKTDVINEEQIRFYAAEILLAIESLHNAGFVHRDLKPDNVFITKSGHCKLGDFGSAAKLIDGKTSSTVPIGTPDYVCRDVLMNNDSGEAIYDSSVDLWTLGVMIYEMITGEPPFYSESLKDTYRKITKIDYTPLNQGSTELKDLLNKLICCREQRLDIMGIKSHPFFRSINWSKIREISPPYVPVVHSDGDISNFVDSNFKPETSTIKGGYKDFVGFTFDPKYVATFGEMLTKQLTTIRNNDGITLSNLHNKVELINKTTNESELTDLLKNLKLEITNSEAKLKVKEQEMNNLLESKMLEIDDLNLTIEDLVTEKDQKQKELIKNREELKKTINELLFKKDELREILESVLEKKQELENLQSDIKKKLDLMNKGQYKDFIRDSIDDLQRTIIRSRYAETIKELKTSIYWFYKEHSVLCKELEESKEIVTDASVDELKKQLRGYKTEIKDYQQKIEAEIAARINLENENKKLNKMLKENKTTTTTIAFNVKNALNDKQIHILFEDGQFIFDDQKYDSNAIYIREIKNQEYHHFPYKKRSLTIVVHFLKEYCCSSNGVAKRSAKAVETELEKELDILANLEDLAILLTDDALKEVQAQINGSKKKLDSLRHELNIAKTSTIQEFMYKDEDRVLEFNNHLFTEHTVGKGTLCDHCNEVIYGVVKQAYHCRDCLLTVHKSCYVLIETSCELQQAINKGSFIPIVMKNIEEKEKILSINK